MSANVVQNRFVLPRGKVGHVQSIRDVAEREIGARFPLFIDLLPEIIVLLAQEVGIRAVHPNAHTAHKDHTANNRSCNSDTHQHSSPLVRCVGSRRRGRLGLRLIVSNEYTFTKLRGAVRFEHELQFFLGQCTQLGHIVALHRRLPYHAIELLLQESRIGIVARGIAFGSLAFYGIDCVSSARVDTRSLEASFEHAIEDFSLLSRGPLRFAPPRRIPHLAVHLHLARAIGLREIHVIAPEGSVELANKLRQLPVCQLALVPLLVH